ncbi:Subtilisin-like protease [Vigna angularis]|uniref:Subtilisin-like protease n=1 Tax=Phaseolus angularis TaxID=3914 RepID=A0A8T0JGZ2_PHAAN|nr:Subtilisin-like protease [Vigna angularis]
MTTSIDRTPQSNVVGALATSSGCTNQLLHCCKLVLGSIIIYTFSSGFYNGTSTLAGIIGTVKAQGMEGFVLVANPSYGDYIAEPMPLIPRVEDAKAILHYYEEKTKRNKKGNAKEFGALAAVGEGRLASFTGRSLIDTKSGQPGPHQCFRTFPQSISTPHVAGIAALMKQHNPSWTPSMIVYAISTTSSKYDHLGHAIMEEGYEVNTLLPATPFDYGSGFVNPNRVVDPGLVLSSGMKFKPHCTNNIVSARGFSVMKITSFPGSLCMGKSAPLNGFLWDVSLQAKWNSLRITLLVTKVSGSGANFDVHDRGFRVGGDEVLEEKVGVGAGVVGGRDDNGAVECQEKGADGGWDDE